MKRNKGNIYLVEVATGERIKTVPVDLTGLDTIGRYERLNYVEDNLMIGLDPREYRVDLRELEGTGG